MEGYEDEGREIYVRDIIRRDSERRTLEMDLPDKKKRSSTVFTSGTGDLHDQEKEK